jgi:hypothetical protein
MKLVKIMFTVIAFSLLMGACAKPPQAEMDKAIDAVARAESDADAVTYGGSSLVRARDAVSRMNAEANAKRYDAAKTHAAEAVAAAEKAIADGRAGAARVRNEATALVAGLRPSATETEQGIKSARAAGLALNFAALNRDFNDAKLNVEQAEAALAGSQYQEALDKGRIAQAGLSDINMRLSAAATPVSRKK